MLSQDLQNIRKIHKDGMDIAFSLETAYVLIRKNKYKKLVYDKIEILPIIDIINEKKIELVPVEEVEEHATDSTPQPAQRKREERRSGPVRRRRIYRQEFVAVWSVKGGTGKTSVVKAAAEAIPEDIKVLIIDLNFMDGGSDLSYLLGLPRIPHVGMYLRDRTRASFQQNVIKYRNNIDVLQAPPKRILVKDMNPGDVIDLFAFARSEYDTVLIDLPNEENELVETAVKYSSKVLLVTLGTDAELNRIKEKHFPTRYRLIVNRPEGKQYTTVITNILKVPFVEIFDLRKDAYKIVDEIYG